jgi:transposase InsO family protein
MLALRCPCDQAALALRTRSYRGEHSPSPNLLDRQFEAERPNQKWLTDVTEFNVRGDKV